MAPPSARSVLTSRGEISAARSRSRAISAAGERTRDSARTPFEQAYDFRYREDIHAAYATWGRKYGAWGVQVGGRGEVVYTTAELQGDSADLAAAVEQLGGDEALFVNDYVSFYPSANLSYTVDDRNQWVLSYNRRVNRPRGRQVNPFVDNADPRNLRYGNPFLRPEYTDGLEFGHQLTTKAVTLTTSLFYKTTRDVIRRYIEVAETGVAYRTYVNLARQSNSGLEVVAMWRKGRTLQVRLNGSVYYQSTNGSNLAPDLGNNGFQGNAGYQVSALVKGDWKVQLDGRYRAPAEYPQGTFAGYVSHSAAVNRDFYDGKLRASVRGGRPNPAGRQRAGRSGRRPLLWWPHRRPRRPRRLVRGAGCRRSSGGRPWPRQGGRSAGLVLAWRWAAPTAAGGARRGGRGHNRHRRRGGDRRGGRQNSPPSKLPPEPRS